MFKLQQPEHPAEATMFIPTPPNSRFIPAEWFKDISSELDNPGLEKIPLENGEEEIDDFVFEGINPENLHDTRNVRLKSFTFKYSGKATKADVELANTQFKKRVIDLYKFCAKYDPNIYTKSLGIETAVQKLERIVKEKNIDLSYFLRGVEELNAFYMPGTEDYEYQLGVIHGESGVPPTAINYMLDLIKQVKEYETSMYKATHIGNNLHQGFSQLSKATNNVALATLQLAENTLASGVLQADAQHKQANETFRATKQAAWENGGKLPPRLGTSF